MNLYSFNKADPAEEGYVGFIVSAKSKAHALEVIEKSLDLWVHDDIMFDKPNDKYGVLGDRNKWGLSLIGKYEFDKAEVVMTDYTSY